MPPTKKALAPVESDNDAIPEKITSKLRRLVIQNFRCIGKSPVSIDLDDIVVLVGPNNAGKSTVLRAYEIITDSSAPKLTIEDFHERDLAVPAVMELFTAVGDDLPGNRWVQKIDGESIVRERWTWTTPAEAAKRQGWDVNLSDWAKDGVPWGAANVAKSRRPTPHRIEAFANPSDQIKEVTDMLLKVLQTRVKAHPLELTGADGKPQRTIYGELLDCFAKTQRAVVEETKAEIEKTEAQLSAFVAEVFTGYKVKFDAKPEDDLVKGLNFFKAGAALQMGPAEGHLSSAEHQGSGARRTLMWAALRYISETEGSKKNDAGVAHLLLLDEPELCLHPNAIRECCNTLYKLPDTGKWQAMITTHSPAFIDLSRNNTTVVRVEREANGEVRGTTVFRPSKAKLDGDEKRELKLLNIYDPHVAEFFFGGRSILVEGDTEYTAFKWIIANEADPLLFKDVHIVRARGKVTIASLAKVLNQFGARYAALHDSDLPVLAKSGNANPAWTNNDRILDQIKAAPNPARVRLVALVPNFEQAMFGTGVNTEKPYNAYQTLQADMTARTRVRELLMALVDFSKNLPAGAVHWSDLNALRAKATESQSTNL